MSEPRWKRRCRAELENCLVECTVIFFTAIYIIIILFFYELFKGHDEPHTHNITNKSSCEDEFPNLKLIEHAPVTLVICIFGITTCLGALYGLLRFIPVYLNPCILFFFGLGIFKGFTIWLLYQLGDDCKDMPDFVNACISDEPLVVALNFIGVSTSWKLVHAISMVIYFAVSAMMLKIRIKIQDEISNYEAVQPLREEGDNEP